MRDIRPDLIERQEDVLKEISGLEDQLKARRADLERLKLTLAAENSRWDKPIQQPLIPADKPVDSANPDFAAFVQGLLGEGAPMTTQQIKERALAQGFRFAPGSEGRAVNFRLIGLERFGRVRRDSAGKWTIRATN